MKKLLFAGIAVSMLAACSQDEVVPVNNDSNAIKFGVTAENGTRANDIYCNDNPFKAFNVFATYQDVPYIDNDRIVSNAQGTAWDNETGLRYWPNSGDVTFYGYVNGTLNTADATAPKFELFTPATEAKDQLDLMYARKTQEKPKNGTEVKLNFRHALSQIVFNTRNDNSNLYVEIMGVSVVNLKGSGIYTLPNAEKGGDTDGNLDHEYGDDTWKSTGRGSWDFGEAQATSKYSVAWDAVAVEGNKTTVNLTDWSKHSSADANVAGTAVAKDYAMLLLPQETAAVNVQNEGTKNEDNTYTFTGSYFLVDCTIWNVAGDKVVKEDIKDADGNVTTKADVVLWDKGNVMIPAAFNWEEGKKYLYTFVFGNGNGGYDPTDPTPDPVLVPITFDVEIDDFYEVDGGEYEYGKQQAK